MRKLHITIVALLLAGAAVLGTVAMTRTARVGAATTQRNDAAYQARVKQLNAAEAKLRRALAAKPAAPAAPAVASAPRVVYRRPAPIVVTLHKRQGDDGHELEQGGRDD